MLDKLFPEYPAQFCHSNTNHSHVIKSLKLLKVPLCCPLRKAVKSLYIKRSQIETNLISNLISAAGFLEACSVCVAVSLHLKENLHCNKYGCRVVVVVGLHRASSRP